MVGLVDVGWLVAWLVGWLVIGQQEFWAIGFLIVGFTSTGLFKLNGKSVNQLHRDWIRERGTNPSYKQSNDWDANSYQIWYEFWIIVVKLG